MSEASQYRSPIVIRWNIDDDYYKDGITLYADGLLEINVGGTVYGKKLAGWFESANAEANLKIAVESLRNISSVNVCTYSEYHADEARDALAKIEKGSE